MEPFPVTRVAHVRLRHAQPAWLVHKLWAEQAVGFVGGTPKTGKTWLALELAVAVASGKACLGCYQVHERGSVLMYAAEDTAEAIRQRVVNIATVRGVGDIERLALGLITVPGLRLDDPDHQERLALTVAKLTPRLFRFTPNDRDSCVSFQPACHLGWPREPNGREALT
jgi:RecA-family ATPase